jgi:hypothetical protein
MNDNNFTEEDIKKYSTFMITSQKNHTPPYEWSDGIFQTFKPVSGDFPIGDNFFGNMQCVNNQTGRGFAANPCGYWENSNHQFYSGTTLPNNNKDINMVGTMFPVGYKSDEVMTTPNNKVVFGYARIGEQFRNR